MDVTTVPELDLTMATITGPFTAEEVLAAIRAGYEESPTSNVIWDFTGASFGQISADDVQHFAAVTREYAPRRATGRTALVLAADVGFGLGRMFASLQEAKGSPHEYEVFRSIDEAMAWIEAGRG